MSIQSKIRDAIIILDALGIPVAQLTKRRRQRAGLALLAVADIKPKSSWEEAKVFEGQNPRAITTREIIQYWNKYYGERTSSGSYDDVRRKDLLLLVLSGLVLASAKNPNANTNSPTRGYAINPTAVDVLRKFRQASWKVTVRQFCATHGTLSDRLERPREVKSLPVELPTGEAIELSWGPHNDLQKAIVEKFLPQFAPQAQVLYIGDTSKKSLHVDESRLKQLGFFELAHDALPDIVAYDSSRNWLFLIEAVHSSNPISKTRHLMLEEMTANCLAPRVYVSVFLDRRALRKWLLDISWETEVWLVESPDHLIHFNGDKFFGPHQPEGKGKSGGSS